MNPQSEQIAGALQEVVGDIESFLSQWLRKAQTELESAEIGSGGAALRKRLHDFQEEKKQWDAKRRHELTEIEQKANQLAEAWLRLEIEQRQILQSQDKPRSNRRELTPPPTPTLDCPQAENDWHAPSAPSPEPNRRTTNSIDQSQPSQPSAMRSLGDAVRQFEQLKREIAFTRASS